MMTGFFSWALFIFRSQSVISYFLCTYHYAQFFFYCKQVTIHIFYTWITDREREYECWSQARFQHQKGGVLYGWFKGALTINKPWTIAHTELSLWSQLIFCVLKTKLISKSSLFILKTWWVCYEQIITRFR